MKVVELVRNAGQHMAILAAFTATDGEYVLTLDADLQNPPEEIPKIVARDGRRSRRRRDDPAEPAGHVLPARRFAPREPHDGR